jgi:hypothetical protein
MNIMYKYPQRKKYKYVIPTIKGDCILQFEQATVNQTKEYIEIMEMVLSNHEMIKSRGMRLQTEYLIELIKERYPCKRYQWRKVKIRAIVLNDMSSYLSEIMWMYHRFRETIYKNVSIKAVNWEKTRPYPFENMFDTIAKNTLIPIDQVYDRLTMEQIWRYSDKITYDNYETFDEWKTANKQVMIQWWLTKEQQEDLELIKRFR